MFVLKVTVMILFFNSATPVPFVVDSFETTVGSRDDCNAQASAYGENMVRLVSDEIRQTEAQVTVDGFQISCEPLDATAILSSAPPHFLVER